MSYKIKTIKRSSLKQANQARKAIGLSIPQAMVLGYRAVRLVAGITHQPYNREYGPVDKGFMVIGIDKDNFKNGTVVYSVPDEYTQKILATVDDYDEDIAKVLVHYFNKLAEADQDGQIDANSQVNFAKALIEGLMQADKVPYNEEYGKIDGIAAIYFDKEKESEMLTTFPGKHLASVFDFIDNNDTGIANVLGQLLGDRQ